MCLRKRKLYFVGTVLILTISVGFVLAIHDRILKSIGNYLVVTTPLERCGAIVPLASHEYDRILEAVDLFKKGFASRIVLSEVTRPAGYEQLLELDVTVPQLHEVQKMIALNLGVPEDRILVIERHAYSTNSELQVIFEFLKQNDLNSVILVTSKYHTRRTQKLFNSITGENIKVIIQASRYDPFDPDRWWKSRRDTKFVIYEYLKLLNYYVKML